MNRLRVERIGVVLGPVSVQWFGALRGVFVGATSIGWRPRKHPAGAGAYFIWKGRVQWPKG